MILSEFIYGGMDGVITTAAIIAGIIGANISTKYALILGLANLCADGFSMAISNYNSLKDLVHEKKSSPLFKACITGLSFVLMGAIPLIPFSFIQMSNEEKMKYMLIVFSFLSFAIIGAIKGMYTKKYLKSFLEVVLIGSIGVYISFYVARTLKVRYIMN
uniref:VIT family protein n=1 Tax=viral metagenome TaxID=1070528 RepID=A0A6C0KM84_9ZZZZ